MTDREIVERLLARDEKGIQEVRKQYGKQLRGIAKNLGLRKEDAEEIENDTLLAAWNSIPPHAPYTYLPSFLSKIARDYSVNRIKQYGRQKRSAVLVELSREMEECLPASEETALEARQISDAVSAFLRTVSSEQRKVFLRRYWFFDSPEAIARHYGMTSGKVRSMLFRLREKLRVYLQKEGIVP